MKREARLIGGVLALLILSGVAYATTWFVHPDSALHCIQAGIDSCSTGDTVLVAEGAYFENINFNGKNIILGSMFLITGDTSYISSTIIDGDSLGSVVTFENGEDSTAVITGFTIQNGSAFTGGGVHCDSSSPSLTNVNISENWASGGGGIHCEYNSSPILTNVTISGNKAFNGGGIHCEYNSSPILTNVTISGNEVSGNWGGGIYCGHNSSPILTRVTISRNKAYWHGGGICCWANSSPILTNVTINRNSITYFGYASAIFCGGNSSPILTNVTISGNTAFGGRGVIACEDSSSLILMNCILWNDAQIEIDTLEASIVTVTYSDIRGGWPGTGNIDEDPVFVSGPMSDYHLCPYTPSPCIDAGNPDPQYNDPENPLIPGYAMWPALGTVRNDMGVYGGPGTEVWATGIEEHEPIQQVATTFEIFPNPFSNLTVIRYQIGDMGYEVKHTTLRIYDATGRLVKDLLRHLSPIGYQSSVKWDGTDDFNRQLPSGVYFLKFQAGDYSATKKLLLIR